MKENSDEGIANQVQWWSNPKTHLSQWRQCLEELCTSTLQLWQYDTFDPYSGGDILNALARMASSAEGMVCVRYVEVKSIPLNMTYAVVMRGIVKE